MKEQKRRQTFPEMHREVGYQVASLSTELEDQEIVAIMNTVDFEAMYDFRREFYKKEKAYNDPLYVRGVRFFDQENGQEYLLQWMLNKEAGRLDFLGIQRSGIPLKILMEILFFHPENNVEMVEFLEKEKYYSFDKEEKKNVSLYFFKYLYGDMDTFLMTKKDRVEWIGHRDRILICLLLEFGKWLDLPGYKDSAPPQTPEEKSLYEVKLMRHYYNKAIWW